MSGWGTRPFSIGRNYINVFEKNKGLQISTTGQEEDSGVSLYNIKKKPFLEKMHIDINVAIFFRIGNQ